MLRGVARRVATGGSGREAPQTEAGLMRSLTYRADGKLSVRWRTIEWWGAAVCLLLQTGAFFPLLMAGPSGELSDPGKAKLRLLSLPVYAFTLLILAQNVRPFLI